MPMSNKQTKKRHYKRITPATVAEHVAMMAILGNGSAVQRELNPEYKAPDKRSQAILAKTPDQTTPDYIDQSMQQIGTRAIERISELVNSNDERIATKNAQYIIDHIRGKAVQRTESKHLSLNIQSVLD